MADNLKIALQGTYSENTDYSDPEFITNWADWELDPDEAHTGKMDVGTASAEDVDQRGMATITLMAIKNTDPTNLVTFVWESSVGAGQSVTIAKNSLFVTSDIVAGGTTTLQATGAAVKVKILTCGT